MPLTALRLVNKPGRRRRKPFPAYSGAGAKKPKRRKPVAQAQPRRKVLKRVKMGKGYRWSYGGKLIPTAKGAAMAKRRRAAKAAARSLTGTKPRVNPRRKKTAAKRRQRNPWVSAGRGGGATWVEPKRRTRKKKTSRRRKTGARMWAEEKRRTRRVVRKRAGAKTLSAAHRRKISQGLKRYHRATTRAGSPPKKRRKTVARKKTTRRRTTRRRTTTTRKPRPGTKAWYSYIGRKGAAARRRGKKRTSTRRRVRRNPPKRGRTYTRTSTRYARKQSVNLRRRPRGKVVRHRIRRRTYRHNRTGARHYRYRIVKRNPGMQDIGNLVKKVLPIYGGMIAARVITGVVDKNVVQQYLVGADKVIKPENAAYAKMAAPALTFLLSVFLGPSVLKGPTGGQLLEGLQLGSLVTTFDTLLSAILPVNAKAYIGLTGYDDMGVLGYGAYMADPTNYSLPPAHATLEPGIGLDVHEAMALDTYVPDNGLGFSVEEALADSEVDYMQRGGAGGSLAKTLFTY